MTEDDDYIPFEGTRTIHPSKIAEIMIRKLRPAAPSPGLTPPNLSGPEKSGGGEPQEDGAGTLAPQRVEGPHSHS